MIREAFRGVNLESHKQRKSLCDSLFAIRNIDKNQTICCSSSLDIKESDDLIIVDPNSNLL